MYGLDPSSPDIYERVKNTDIVMPKPDSQLYNQIKNSETFQKWVADNYWKIKNNETYQTSIEFPKTWKNDNAQRSLFATIHNADLYPKLNDDGSMTLTFSDGYDFSLMNKMNYSDIKNIDDLKNRLKHNILADINNNAYKQQEINRIKNYLLTTQVYLSKEELEKILQKYGD